MLHDPSSYTPPPLLTEISLEPAEKETLKRLAEETARIAADPSHREKAELWRRLNDLDSVRPMVWINEIPWHEMNVDYELTLVSENVWARELETRLRRTIVEEVEASPPVTPWRKQACGSCRSTPGRTRTGWR
jgi:hypothetical protein